MFDSLQSFRSCQQPRQVPHRVQCICSAGAASTYAAGDFPILLCHSSTFRDPHSMETCCSKCVCVGKVNAIPLSIMPKPLHPCDNNSDNSYSCDFSPNTSHILSQQSLMKRTYTRESASVQDPPISGFLWLIKHHYMAPFNHFNAENCISESSLLWGLHPLFRNHLARSLCHILL